jgi:ferredoxin-NADP reductase
LSSNLQSSQQEECSVLGYPSRLLGRTEIAKKTPAIRLARPRNFLFKAGQFVDLSLLGDPPDRANGLRHTFSIASSPSAEEIVVATRMRDTPFKRALAVLPLGTDLRIEGPMGSFNLHNNTGPAVLLAGGIGIAPFVSMLSYAAEERLRHPIVLFYANRHLEDAAFLGLLWRLERANPRFRCVPTFTRTTNNNQEWRGETGRITPEMISKHVSNLCGPIFYIAGPPSMVAAARRTLIEAAVDEDDIRTEEFAGY